MGASNPQQQTATRDSASKIRAQIQKEFLPGLMPRVLYFSAIVCAAILVWPDPVTVFLAACFSCLTLPFYRKLRLIALKRIRRLLRKKPQSCGCRALIHLSRATPLLSYTLFVVCTFAIPTAALVMLVAPQAAAGYARLQQLKAANFQLPPQWVEYIHHLRSHFASHPFLEKTLNDGISQLESFIGDAVGAIVSHGVSIAGSAINVVWLTILFLMLTIPFTQYARQIRKVFSRTLRMPNQMVGRFIVAVHKALKAIMLGIILVAVIQGALCGLGFYVAGISQPAFWGLLATFFAPIPAIGTALVWLPLCVDLWFTGKTVAAIGLALWGALFVGNLDSALRPFFLKRGIKAPFLC